MAGRIDRLGRGFQGLRLRPSPVWPQGRPAGYRLSKVRVAALTSVWRVYAELYELIDIGRRRYPAFAHDQAILGRSSVSFQSVAMVDTDHWRPKEQGALLNAIIDFNQHIKT
jgi:hypothetical protein